MGNALLVTTPLTLAGIWDDGNRANKLAGVVCTCGSPVLLQTLFKDLVLNNREVQRVGDVIARVSSPFVCTYLI